MKTSWFPADVAPVRVGWYEVRWRETGVVFRKLWQDGRWWFRGNSGSLLPSDFARADAYGAAWRGLKAPC